MYAKSWCDLNFGSAKLCLPAIIDRWIAVADYYFYVLLNGQFAITG